MKDITYHGTHFNVDWVKSLTKKQFQTLGALGNKLTQAQLSEAYDLITHKKQESGTKNNGKYVASSGKIRRVV